MDLYFSKPFSFVHGFFIFEDFYIKESDLGWKTTDRDAAIATFQRDDPLYYYMYIGIDIGFYYNGNKYWIESPSENLRGHGGDFWSLAICDTPNPEWSGDYLYDQFLGLERHDAENRRELCFYDGIDNFIVNAKIKGQDLRAVLNASYITDL